MFQLSTFWQGFMEESKLVFFTVSAADHQISYLNPAAQTVLQLDPARANEQLPDLLARVHPDDQPFLAQCWTRWLAGELHERLEFRLSSPSGTDQWLCLTPFRQEQAGQLWLGGTIEDITLPRAYLTNAHKFNAKKNATLEILSHDLAGPFILLQQLAEYVGEEVAVQHNPNLRHLLEVMRTTCQDSVNLIRDFVDQEFLESANVQLKRDRLDLAGQMRQLMEDYQRNQSNLGKHFSFQASHPSIYLSYDDNKFQQVINNLISNAIKFTPDDGHIAVRVEEHPGHVLVVVADDGIGIPPEYLPVLFDRFTPARRAGLRGEKTTGLGMSIIKTIIGLHHGSIRVESEEGRGSTFFIELPRLAD